MTIDKAIEELNDRMELWMDYRERGRSIEGAEEWLTVLQMSRDALMNQRANAAYMREVRDKLDALDDNDGLAVRLVKDILSDFKLGGDANGQKG